jgi:hypothetical protein
MEQNDSCACWICGGFSKSKDNISKWYCYGIGASCYTNDNYDCCITIPPFFHYSESGNIKKENTKKENLFLYWGLGGFCKQKDNNTVGWCMTCYICPFGITRGSCFTFACDDSIYCCGESIWCCGNNTKCLYIDKCCNVNKNKYEPIQYICFPFGCIESEPIVQKNNNDDVLIKRKLNVICMCCDIDDCYSISTGAPKDDIPDPIITEEKI